MPDGVRVVLSNKAQPQNKAKTREKEATEGCSYDYAQVIVPYQ